MQIIHLPARFMRAQPDPRDPDVSDPYPEPSSLERAKAAQLCERASCLDQLQNDEDREHALRHMDKPSYADLQMVDSVRAYEVADLLAGLLCDGRALTTLPLPVQHRLRYAAATALRLAESDAWRRHAQDAAFAQGLLAAQELLGRYLTDTNFEGVRVPMTKEKKRAALRPVTDQICATYAGVLTGSLPVSPADYLRLVAERRRDG